MKTFSYKKKNLYEKVIIVYVQTEYKENTKKTYPLFAQCKYFIYLNPFLFEKNVFFYPRCRKREFYTSISELARIGKLDLSAFLQTQV